MKGKLLFLGTGGSVGVPIIGCSCDVCRSKERVNQRLRPSVLVTLPHRQFIIDTGPDFRSQALYFGITHLDGVLFTHAHYDHIAGIDDLRPLSYYRQSPLPFLLSSGTAQEIQARYDYLFSQDKKKEEEPKFSFHLLPDFAGEVVFEGVTIQYVSYQQGAMLVNGYRIGDLAYLSDIRDFSPSIFQHLKGIKYLIISALRYTPSPLHLSIDEAIDFAKTLNVKYVWLTHLSHELDYHRTNAYLPANIRLAYDGLQIEFD